MNSAEMKAKLAEIRFEHDNGTHDFDEDSDRVQRADCTSCFLISTIDTMIARRWDPTVGGPRDYAPDDTPLDTDSLESWLERTRGVAPRTAVKDRILALMTSTARVNEDFGKALMVEFAGQVAEQAKKEVLDNLSRDGVITEPPLLGKDPAVDDLGGWAPLERLIGRALMNEIRRQG